MKPRLLKFYIWGFVLVLVISFIWAEVMVRAVIPHRDLYEMTGRTPTLIGNDWAATDAFAAYKGRPGFAYVEEALTKTINRFGFISTPDLPISKPPRTLRVVFLGGSSTAGTGINLSDSETWPWRVIQTLRAEYPQQSIDFINAAVGGYTSFESYGRLWSRLRFFDPDVIVVNHGWNEMAYFQTGVLETITEWREAADGDWRYQQARRRQMFDPQPWDPLIRPSQALTHLRLALSYRSNQGELTENDPTAPLSKDFDRRGLEVYRQNLQLIKSASAMIGAKLFIIKQPTLIVPDLPPELQKECGYHNHGFDHKAHIRAYEAIYRVIDEEIVAADIIDLRDLSGQKEMFYDHVHPTFPLGVNAYTSRVARAVSSWYRKLTDRP